MNRSLHLNHPWRAGALGACLLLAAAGSAAAQQPASGAAASAALGIELGNFDRSVRPQDDFYRAVNGGWLKHTAIPADRSNHGSFSMLGDLSQDRLRALLEEAAAAPDRRPGSDAQKVGDLYLSVLDTARIEALGLTPLREELRQVAALKSRQELPDFMAAMQKLGVQTPLGFYVGQDQKQATRYIAYASQSGLGLPDRDYYLKQDAKFAETRAAYEQYIATLLRLAGEKDPAGAAKAILALETQLAGKHWDRAKNRDREATYNQKSVAELRQLMPGFDWARYLKAIGAAQTPAVVVRQPDYLQALDAILAATPVATLRQYFTFKLLDSYSPALSRDFADARFAFRGRVLQGLQEPQARWRQAVGMTEDILGEVAGRLYVERHFSPEQKARMQVLVSNLTEAFRAGIDSLEWMSPETKQQAQAKLARFNVKIGYPDQWRDYSGLEIRRDDLVGNLQRSIAFGHQRMVGRLGRPIDRSEWGMTPQTVNAYYSSTMNEIVFPAAILQPPFFNMEADDAVNYGAIGGVIGHEISHGFDDQGRRSDGDGNLRDWWTEADNAAFKQRADALVAQYDAFSPIEGMHVNGRLTLGENIGDLSGLTVAYKAYQRSLGGKPAPVIDGFTADQRFFLGWAQIWKRLYRDEEMRNRLLTDPHSPSEYRVNGTLRNMPEFHAAFATRPGDGMWLDPEKRVKIW